MNILILGAGSFIGTNLAIEYHKKTKENIIAYDLKKEYMNNIQEQCGDSISYVEGTFEKDTDFDSLLEGVDIIYHLISKNIPANSNKNVEKDMEANVMVTIKLLDACVRKKVKKLVFISSGGAAYGKESEMPLLETTATNPITSYGIQKVTIEKLLYLYRYMYGLDYRIIRLANPYGPYQRPDSGLGVITKFVYNAIHDQRVEVFGDGEVVRDFIYIEDAIKAILNITNGEGIDRKGKKHKTFNVGSGIGKSINDIVNIISKTLNKALDVEYKEARHTDVPVNYLDISLYEEIYGKLIYHNLEEGINKTKNFLEIKS